MSKEGLRALAKKLASNAEFKKRVLSGEETLAAFDLNAEERKAVLKTRHRLVLATNAGEVESEQVPLGFWF